jgi:hypothetical protein
MPDQPLQAFAPPMGLPFAFPTTITPHTLLGWLFALVMVYWIIYTVVAIHHWLTYSHNSAVAFPAITTHLFISFLLIVYAASGLL